MRILLRVHDAVILALMSGVLAWAFLTGRAANLIAARYVWFPAAGAILLAVLAVAAVSVPAFACGCGGEHDHGHGHDHGHALRPSPIALLRDGLLLAPFVLAVLVDPVRLSTDGLRKRQSPRAAATPEVVALRGAIAWIVDAQAATGSLPGVNAGVRRRDLLPASPTVKDVVKAWETGLARDLTGTAVTLIGQCMQGDGSKSNEFELVRTVVVCCLADAVTVGVPVRALPGTQARNGEWLRLTGTLQQAEDALGQYRPRLDATRVERVPEPECPFL